MSIRSQLTLLFSFITGMLLLAFAATVYFSAKKDREEEFYTALEKEAITKLNLFSDAKIDTKTLQDIYKNNSALLNEVEVAIYDNQHNLLYHDAVDVDIVKETPELLESIKTLGKIQFYQDKWQVIGLSLTVNQKNYIVTAAAFDLYGYNKINNIFNTVALSLILSIALSFFAGRYFTKKALKPVANMTQKVQKISATNLHLRLDEASKDELGALANTFNEMLHRLEQSFLSQKDFVSNISHELRTPLAMIIAELELTKNTENIVELKETLQSTLDDAKKIVKLANSLLDLAKASYDTSQITFKPLRIDELILDAFETIQKNNPTYKITIAFQTTANADTPLMVAANEYLMKIALQNIIENGCKFSNNQTTQITIENNDAWLTLHFENTGNSIEPHEQEHLFKPFFRAEKTKHLEGNGIGLYLTQKIIFLHQGDLSLKSDTQNTIFQIKLPLT